MSLNKAMLIGRLGMDPEVRYTKSGGAVVNFRMATDSRYKDAQGNRQEQTEWHSIVAFGKLADFAQNWLKKGREVYVEGRIQTRDWTDKENVKHYKTEIVAHSIQFVGPKPAGEDGPRAGGEAQGSGGQGQGGGKPRPSGPPPGPPQGPPAGEGGDDYMEDDIPF
jgi:single-strand DNA-binding protein